MFFGLHNQFPLLTIAKSQGTNISIYYLKKKIKYQNGSPAVQLTWQTNVFTSLFFVFFSDVTAYTSALKTSIRRQTEFQTKSVASSTISSVKTDDIFTNLLIQHGRKPVENDFHLERKEFLGRYGQVSETHRVKNCQEIFVRTNDEDSNPKSILLTGKAGIGKTLFSQKLIRDWADDNLFQVNTEAEVPDFKFAYLLTFRQLNLLEDDPVTLREILNRSSVLDDHSIIDECLFEYIANHPEEVLIVIDGFDEYSQQDYIVRHLDEKYPNSAQEKMPAAALCGKLIKGDILSGSVVITTSRPDESDQLRAGIRIRFDRFVEIIGFSEEQVKEYIEKYFRDDENMKNTVLDHIARNEELVSFAHIPVLCFLMCSYMEYLLKESLGADSLPVKASDLYFEVFNKFVLDHKRKEIPSESTVEKLSELAAELLLKKKYLFDEEDMTKFDSLEVESLRASGILHSGPPFKKSAFEETKHFCFTHLTLQEYLAARWFVERGEIPSMRKVSSMVMQFMAGILSKKKDNESMEKLLEVLQSEETDRVSFPIGVKCLAEYENKDFAKKFIKKHPAFRNLVFGGVTDVDCIAISFLLDVFVELNKEATTKHQQVTKQPLSVKTLEILSSILTQSGIRRICKSLDKEFCPVVRLLLFECGLNDECVEYMRGLVSSRLTVLTLVGNQITDAGVTSLSQALQSSACKVTTLHLGCFQITHAGVTSLSQALQSPACKVTTLNLGGNQITDAGVTSLSQALQSPACKVTKLHLNGNQITDAGATSLSQALQSPACKVTTLNLAYNQITDAGATSLCQALQSPACKLTSLHLTDNQITDAGVTGLSQALQSPACKVTTLDA